MNITDGENLFVRVFRTDSDNLPPTSYFYFLGLGSRNFSMLISERLAPRSLELILLPSLV